MSRSYGPAKGHGNGKPRAAPLNGQNSAARPRDGKGKFMAAKMRGWRETHPEWAEKPTGPSKKAIRDYISSGIPDVIDKAFTLAMDDMAPKHFDAIKMLTEQHLGRPAQAVEVSGAEGGPLQVQIVRFGATDQDPE